MIDDAVTQPTEVPRMPDYEMIRCVGSGAFGDVWLARAKATQRFRAIKLVCRSRFPRASLYEIEFAGLRKFEEISREHAGFIDILHISRNDEAGCFSYVMELADDVESGQTFDAAHYAPKTVESELAARAGPGAENQGWFTPAECVHVALCLTAALSALHESGLAHRDIKPSNIVFVRGVPKLADVGLVTELKEEAAPDTLIGSPPFMDPLVHGTALGDIFAFGKVLYVMATGRPVQDWPEAPSDLSHCADIDTFHELLHISQKACDPERSRRYQTADEIHKQLLLLRVGHSLRRLQRLEQLVGSLKRFAVVAAIIACLAGLFIYQTVERHKQAAELRQHQVGSFVAYGTRALDEGDLLGALPWFAEALRQDRDDPLTEPLHRLRLGMLLRQCPKIIQMWFTDHPINHAQFAGQENQVLLPTPDSRWAIHDLATGRVLYPPFGPAAGSDTVSISPSAGLAVTSSLSSSNDVVHVWNYITGQEIAVLHWPGGVNQAAISSDGRWVAASAQPDSAILWNLATRERVWTLSGHTGSIFSLAFNHDGTRLVTAGADRTAIVWNLQTGALVSQFTNHTSWIYSAAFSPDGRHVATAGFDRSVRLWEAATARQILAPLPHGDGVHGVEFSADGSRLVTAGLDFSVRVWDARTGSLIQQLRHHSKPLSAGFSPSGRYIVTACYDGTERIWLLRPPQFAPEPTPACYSGDGLVCASPTNRSLQITRANSAEPPQSFPLGNLQLLRAVLNRDATRLLTLTEPPPGSPSNSLQATLWDPGTAARLGDPVILDRASTNLVMSPDAGHAWATLQNTDVVWDFTRNRAALKLRSSPQAAAFDASGKYFASAANTNIQVWDLAGAEPRLRSSWSQPFYVGSIEWSPDGLHVVTACWDTSFNPEYARVWDSLTGTPASSPLNHRDGVRFAAFSPDGDKVVTCGEDSVAILWDWRTGRQLTPPLRHKDHVVFAAFSSDGHRLATACRDGAVRVWDADTGEPITQSLEHPQEIERLQWVEGGTSLLTRTLDGQTRVWKLQPDQRRTDKLVQIANLLSAQQIHSTGSAIPETKEGLRQLWEELRTDYPTDFSLRP